MMFVSVSCYYVKEKVSGRDICVIHSQRWEFSHIPIEISRGSMYKLLIKCHLRVCHHHQMQRYFLSVFPRTDLKCINSTACLEMTMTEAKSCDTLAAFQTMHFMKCCKWWHKCWACNVRSHEDKL
jgi:hypothetical protein